MSDLIIKYRFQFIDSITLYFVAGLIASLGSPITVFFQITWLPNILYGISLLMAAAAIFYLVQGISNYLSFKKITRDKSIVDKIKTAIDMSARKKAIKLYILSMLAFPFGLFIVNGAQVAQSANAMNEPNLLYIFGIAVFLLTFYLIHAGTKQLKLSYIK